MSGIGPSGCFAILPDETSAGADGDQAPRPLALFDNLEDAIDWGSKRYRGGAFRIRFMQYLSVSGDREPRTTLAS